MKYKLTDEKLTGCFGTLTRIQALIDFGSAKAYNEAAIKYHGEFARLNEIPSL